MPFPNMSVPIAQVCFLYYLLSPKILSIYKGLLVYNNRSPLYIDYKKIHSRPMILKQHRHRRDNNEKKL